MRPARSTCSSSAASRTEPPGSADRATLCAAIGRRSASSTASRAPPGWPGRRCTSSSGPRAGLFDAFAADILERGGFQRVLDAVADRDPRVHLRDGITGGVHTFAAHRDVFRALVSMAALDPDAVGGSMRRSEERRAKGMARLARRLARHGLLRDGLTARAAADRLWVLTSFDAFDLLHEGRGLPAAEVARVLVDAAERTVLADP